MTLDQLTVLEAVVETGSFRAAAERLHRVQSAVSYAIKTLESSLGVRLFSREEYRPKLTAQGRAVYQRAQRVLEGSRELIAMAGHLRAGEEPLLRMDVAPTCPMKPLVPVFEHLRLQHPATQLAISSETFGGEQLVLEGSADLAITDMIRQDQALETALWAEVTLFPVASAHHPLATLPEEDLDGNQLARHVQVLVSRGSHGQRRTTRGVLEGASTWAVADFDAKKTLLLSGLGWGNMPQHLIEEELASGVLQRLRIQGLEAVQVLLHLVRRRAKSRGPVAAQLWQTLVDGVESPRFTSSRPED